MMIKSKFHKQNGDDFLGLFAVLCKKKDLEGKILQGLSFCTKRRIGLEIHHHFVYKTLILSSFFCLAERKQNSENDFCGDIEIFDFLVFGNIIFNLISYN